MPTIPPSWPSSACLGRPLMRPPNLCNAVRTCALVRDGRVAPHEHPTRYASNFVLERLGPVTRVIVPCPRLMAPSVDGIRPCIRCAEYVAISRSLAGRLRGKNTFLKTGVIKDKCSYTFGGVPFRLDGGPLRKANVDDHFKRWIKLPAVAGAQAARYSVHSFRSYLATALAESGASTSRIQAMLRWASDDAVNIYNRTTEAEYSGWVRAAASAEIDTILTHHLPRAEARRDGTRAREITYEPDDMVGELMEAREFNALLEEAAADA